MVETTRLIEYNEEVRHGYLDKLKQLSWEDFVEDREASWHSIRNIFIHTLNAVDHWLDFLQYEKLHVRREYDEYKSFKEIEEYMQHVEARMRKYFSALTTDSLQKSYSVQNDANEHVQVTAEDILVHVFEEEVHHREALIALLWQMDIEPPLMGWKYL